MTWSSRFATAVPMHLLVSSLALSLCGQTFSQGGQPTKVAVADVELHYIEQGRGDAVILLHGGQGDYRAWPSLIEALRKEVENGLEDIRQGRSAPLDERGNQRKGPFYSAKSRGADA